MCHGNCECDGNCGDDCKCKKLQPVVVYCNCPAQNSADCCCPEDDVDLCCPQHNERPIPSSSCPLHKHLPFFPKNAKKQMTKWVRPK